MYKEISIIIIVIALILFLDVITNSYTSNATNILSEELNVLREYVLSEKEEKINKQMEEIENKWERYNEVLAYYIEHDELEKVETELTTLKGGLEVKEYTHCIGNLDATIFILEHIQDKEKFSIQSIF